MAVINGATQGSQGNQGAAGVPSLGGVMRLGDAPPDFAGVASEMFKGLIAMFSPQKAAATPTTTTTSTTKDEIAKARAEGKAEAEDEAKKKAAPTNTTALETPKVADEAPRIHGTPILPLSDNVDFVSHAGTGLKIAD